MSALTVPASSLSQATLNSIRNVQGATQHERKILLSIAEKLANGPIVVANDDDAYSPNQCAKLLGVSRAHFNKILDSGAIPFFTVGQRDRRIKSKDFWKYHALVEETRRVAASNAAHADDLYFDLLDEM